MARQLFTDNVAIAGRALPLEMHCIGANLDDAVVVLDLQSGPIAGVEYAGDSGLLVAVVNTMSPTSPESKEPGMQAFFRPSNFTRYSMSIAPLFFASGVDHLHYAKLASVTRELAEARLAFIDEDFARRSPVQSSIRPVAISPDGRRMACLVAEGGLRIVDMRSGREEALLIGPRDRMARATFSRDGRRIVTVENNSVLRLWDADSGRLLTTCSGEGGSIGGVTFSGDGSRFAFRVYLGRRRQDRFLVYASADGRQLSAVEALAGLAGVIAPFPGGVVRSGSKVGSRYKALRASTSDSFCPTLRGRVESKLHPEANCAYEIVIDGVSQDAVGQAMAAALRAAAGDGVVVISAGNYGGKLGKFHFRLRDLL